MLDTLPKMSGGRGKGGRSNKGRGRGGRNAGPATNRNNPSHTELSHYTYQVGLAKQGSDFITVNDYLVRYIKMNYEMGRDIVWWLRLQARGLPTAVNPNSGINLDTVEIQSVRTAASVGQN